MFFLVLEVYRVELGEGSIRLKSSPIWCSKISAQECVLSKTNGGYQLSRSLFETKKLNVREDWIRSKKTEASFMVSQNLI